MNFNEVVEKAFDDKAPHKICEYTYAISNSFNKFYSSNRIITEENLDRKMSWMSLITLTKNVLETGLDLLGLEVPNRM